MTDMMAAPFSTPELRAALEWLKEIILANVSEGMIEEHAFRLVGESRDTVDREIRGLFEVFASNRRRYRMVRHSD
jgi:hypothetical protein